MNNCLFIVMVWRMTNANHSCSICMMNMHLHNERRKEYLRKLKYQCHPRLPKVILCILFVKWIACNTMSEDFKYLQCLFSFGISRGSFISQSPSQTALSLEKSPILKWEKRRAGTSQISVNYVPTLALNKSHRCINIKHNCFV